MDPVYAKKAEKAGKLKKDETDARGIGQMISQKTAEKERLLRQLERERKRLNETIQKSISSPECLACSRRVDALLEQLLELRAE